MLSATKQVVNTFIFFGVAPLKLILDVGWLKKRRKKEKVFFLSSSSPSLAMTVSVSVSTLRRIICGKGISFVEFSWEKMLKRFFLWLRLRKSG